MRETPKSLMLFAAGFGARMGALTVQQPKPLIPVAGRPLIEHALDVVTDAGIGKTVVNTHYMPEIMEKYLSKQKVAISHEVGEILETGGGLRHALPLLGTGPVFTFNSDAIWAGPNPLTMLDAAWNPEKMDALLLLIPQTDAADDFTLATDGRIRRVGNQKYSGAQIIKTAGLAQIRQPVFSLNLYWDRLIEKGRAYGLIYHGGWCDVGTPDGIITAERMLASTTNV